MMVLLMLMGLKCADITINELCELEINDRLLHSAKKDCRHSMVVAVTST
jgi:hypothetical protein